MIARNSPLLHCFLLSKVVLTRLKEKRRPPPLTIVEPTEDESGTDDQSRLPEDDQLDNQLVLGLDGLRLATTPPCPQATVQEGGFVRLTLSHGVTVDVTPEQAFRVSNPFQESSIAISSCGRQIAVVHPAGWQLSFNVSSNLSREVVAIRAQNRVAGDGIQSCRTLSRYYQLLV